MPKFPIIRSAATSAASSVTSRTATPPHVEVGDLLVAVFSCRAGSKTLVEPAGWIEIREWQANNSWMHTGFYYKFSDGSDSFTFDISGSGNSYLTLSVCAVGNVDPHVGVVGTATRTFNDDGVPRSREVNSPYENTMAISVASMRGANNHQWSGGTPIIEGGGSAQSESENSMVYTLAQGRARHEPLTTSFSSDERGAMSGTIVIAPKQKRSVQRIEVKNPPIARPHLRFNASDPINRDIMAWHPMNDGAGREAAASLLPGQEPLECSNDARLVTSGSNPSPWGGAFGLNQNSADSCFRIRPGTNTGFQGTPARWFRDPGGTFTGSVQAYVSNGGSAYIMAWADGGAVGSMFRLRKTGDDILTLDIGSESGGFDNTQRAAAISLNQWYHFIFRIKDPDIDIFVDSFSDRTTGTNTNAGDFATGSSIYNGFGYGGSRLYNTVQNELAGGVLNGRFWGRALEDDEIKRLFADPWAGSIQQ